MVIIDLKLQIQLCLISTSESDAICKLNNYRCRASNESYVVIGSEDKLFFWTLKLTKTTNETSVIATSPEELWVDRENQNILYEMENGWVVNARRCFARKRSKLSQYKPLLLVCDLESRRYIQQIYDKWDVVFAIAELKGGHIAANCTKSIRCWDVAYGQETWSVSTARPSLQTDPFHPFQLSLDGLGKDMIKLKSQDTLCFSSLAMMDSKRKVLCLPRRPNNIKGHRIIELNDGTLAVSQQGSVLVFRIPKTYADSVLFY